MTLKADGGSSRGAEHSPASPGRLEAPSPAGWVRTDPLKVGHHPPEQCARGRTDCRSLAQIVSSDCSTFVCCGEVAPDATPWPADEWAFCIRGSDARPGVEGTDVRFFVDRMDLSHMAAVASMGLAMALPAEIGGINSTEHREGVLGAEGEARSPGMNQND